MNKTLVFSAFTLGLLLSACGHTGTSVINSPDPTTLTSGTATNGSVTGTVNTDTLSPLGIAATSTLIAGQTKQFNVTVNGVTPTAGQLVWTTTNSSVVRVTQTGLATAVNPGTATVRAALATNTASYIDFPISVGAATTTPATTPSAFAQQVLTLTNSARAVARTCGTTSYAAAPALTYNAQLAQSAQAHASDMASKNYFSHTSQDGRTFDQRISATGYAWRTIGENIAAGQSTPAAVVNGWLQSPGHCANIMNPAFKELGVGYAYSAASTYKYYWVQDFGAR